MLGSFGISIRKGLKIDTPMTAVIDSTTAAGTATRNIRTSRLWRAATAKRASSPASYAGLRTEFTAAPTREIGEPPKCAAVGQYIMPLSCPQ
jgi:hypothetical protein